MIILRFLTLILASRRLTTLVVDDEITKPIRLEILKRFPAETSKFGYLVSCRKCASVWTSAIVSIADTIGRKNKRAGSLTNTLLDTLAISEIVIITDEILSKTNSSMFD